MKTLEENKRIHRYVLAAVIINSLSLVIGTISSIELGLPLIQLAFCGCAVGSILYTYAFHLKHSNPRIRAVERVLEAHTAKEKQDAFH